MMAWPHRLPWFLVSYDHMYGGNAGLAQSKYLSVHLENNSVRYLCFRDVELVFGVNIMESTHRHPWLLVSYGPIHGRKKTPTEVGVCPGPCLVMSLAL
jgi:hypothetical protein